MADDFHSLRRPITEPGPGTAGALLADNALSAGPAVPAGAPPPGYALAAGQQPVTAQAQADLPPYAAGIAALSLHLTVIILIFFISALGSLFGFSRQLGTAEGRPENLNVSVITAAELDRLHSSASLHDQIAKPGPLGPAETSSPEPQEVLVPPLPATQEAAQQPSPQPRQNASRDQPFDASAFAAVASAQFSSQLKHEFEAAEARAQRQSAARRTSLASGRVRSTRPGATHIGRSDEFERAVIWALGATVPEGNGKWGSTIVTFTVSAAGQPDGLRLLKSSGDNWLDGAALMAVKQARIPSPPPGLPTGDRTFVIEYISLPSRVR